MNKDLQTKSRPEVIISEFIRVTEEHISDLLALRVEKRKSTKDIAEMLFIAPKHLTNTLKSVRGISPCEYMEERLSDEAKIFLSETNLTISEIALRFGYRDTTNFIKFFKGMTSVTPLQFRKLNRGK